MKRGHDVTSVIFFGDSICVGQYVSLHSGWVTRISAHLSTIGKAHKRDVRVANVSGNGRITRQALERMGYEVQSHPLDFLIVQFGLNDCNYWQTDRGLPRVSPAAFEANLEEIVVRGLHFGAKKVFLNNNHPVGLDGGAMPHTNITYQQSNEAYNEVIRNLAERFDSRVVFNDIEKAFLERTSGNREKLLEYLLPEPDLVHLSEPGHELYFDLVYPAIKSAVLDHFDNDC